MPRHDRRQPPSELIWTVKHFYSPDECRAAIETSEAAGFDEALITTRGGMVMNKAARNNDRHIFDSPELAERLYGRLQPHVPATIRERRDDPRTEWTLCGLNERFRVYRYDLGHRFKPHFDGAFNRVEDVEESALTFMIYLNDGFDGGETRFLDEDVVVRPVAGDALLFFHGLRHEGAEVTRGRKYVLRSDVMYRRVNAP